MWRVTYLGLFCARLACAVERSTVFKRSPFDKVNQDVSVGKGVWRIGLRGSREWQGKARMGVVD